MTFLYKFIESLSAAYLEPNDLLPVYQSDFLKDYLTDTLLVHLFSDIMKVDAEHYIRQYCSLQYSQPRCIYELPPTIIHHIILFSKCFYNPSLCSPSQVLQHCITTYLIPILLDLNGDHLSSTSVSYSDLTK